MSFLIDGGYDLANLYVDLIRERDGKLFLKGQIGTIDETLIPVI